ncbi:MULTISPECIES: hypothetical protein [unclassified Streptomyces]|uniref:hypothetical protein n=1 Tax=unclassified Streptomyces TaxID=2593676 RepID=UPI003FA3AE74
MAAGPWVMTPLRRQPGRDLTPTQRTINRALSGARAPVERSGPPEVLAGLLHSPVQTESNVVNRRGRPHPGAATLNELTVCRTGRGIPGKREDPAARPSRTSPSKRGHAGERRLSEPGVAGERPSVRLRSDRAVPGRAVRRRTRGSRSCPRSGPLTKHRTPGSMSTPSGVRVGWGLGQPVLSPAPRRCRRRGRTRQR